MSPIQTAGVRGYADWQRVENWDGPTIFSSNSGLPVDVEATTVLDVSRFAYIGGFDNVTLNTVTITLSWFADKAGTVALGARVFTLSPLMGSAAQYRIPNLGPFVQITWAKQGATKFIHLCVLIGTNRYNPLEFIPQTQLLMQSANVAIGAASTVNVFPLSYYAGPVNCAFTSVSGGSQFIAAAINNAGSSINLTPLVTPAAGVLSVLSFIVPAGAWLMQVSNPGAATNFYITCTPTLTGSS